MFDSYKNVVIDGNNFIYRAFYTKRPEKIINGINTTPIYYFLYMLKNVMERFRPENVYFTWDKRLNPNPFNFRREIHPAYKQQRVETDDIRTINSYFDLLIELCTSLGIKTILPYNLEGDDVIYYICNEVIKDEPTIVISSDKDLLQLVTETLHQFLPLRDTIVSLENFEANAGCKKEDFTIYKAILGDISDNIQGVPKYGIVRAKGLAEKINAQTNAEVYLYVTSEQLDIINTNLCLMDLSYKSQYHEQDWQMYKNQLESQKDINFDRDTFLHLLEKYGFYNFVREIALWGSLFHEKLNDSENDWMKMLSM